MQIYIYIYIYIYTHRQKRAVEERQGRKVSHFDNELLSSRSRSCAAYRPLKFLWTNADAELISFLLTGRFNKHHSARARIAFPFNMASPLFRSFVLSPRECPLALLSPRSSSPSSFLPLFFFFFLFFSLCLSVRERSLWHTTRYREIHRGRWTVKTTRLTGGFLARSSSNYVV